MIVLLPVATFASWTAVSSASEPEFVKKLDFEPSGVAFDAAFEKK